MKNWKLFFLYSMWEHFLGKVGIGSTWSLIGLILKGRTIKMEKDIALGSLGALDLSFSGGKAIVGVKASVDGGALTVNLAVTADAGLFIDQLQAIVEKAVPVSAPFDPAIFAVIKSAVLGLG